MNVSHLVNVCGILIATTAVAGNVPNRFDGYVLDAIEGTTFVVKKWADYRTLKSITVSKNGVIRLNLIWIKSIPNISKDKYGVILLQYNNPNREASLMFANFSKDDEGIYNVTEIIADTSPSALEREDGSWTFKLNVIKPSEVMTCGAGGIFRMEIREWSTLRNLYYYDQIAVPDLFICKVVIHPHLHGRLRCGEESNRYVIIINVTQRDIGLYTVGNTSEGREKPSTRYYLNVTDQATKVTIGENMTIDWSYSQQAINQTMRIIHPNNGIMMTLQPDNKQQIVPAFSNRLVYIGDVSRCYMSFTLMHIRKSDSGVFKIETIHGTTVSGSKHILVEGVQTENEVTESTLTITKDTTRDSSSTGGPYLASSSAILDTKIYTTSPSLSGRLTSPDYPVITHAVVNTAIEGNHQTWQTSSLLVDVKYVVVGALGLMLMMIGCFIWIHRSNRHSMKAVQRLVLAASSSTLNSAPSAKRNQLPTSIVDDEGLCQLILSTPVVKSQSVLKYRSNPDNSLSFDTPSSFAMTVPIIEDDKPGLTCKKTLASKECNTIAKQTPSYTHDNNMCGLLGDCPAACISGSASSNAAVGLREPDQFNYHPYAKVKRGPKSTSTNNNQFAFSAVPDGECSDGYNMVNFTLGNEPQSTLQNLEFVSESTIQGNVLFHAEKDNTRKNYVRDLQNDDGYETCGNINHMTLVEHVKDSEDEGAMTGKYQEPTHCMIPRCARHSDYADIRI